MAGMYPSAWVDEVLARADIVDIVTSYLPLKRQGRNFVGLCPFHNEKTPSFSVNRDSNVYHCFGCKAGGNVAQFVMEMEKLTFPEALRHIAKLLNIAEPVQAFDPRAERERSAKEKLYEINREAALFYHSRLYSQAGKQMLDYLYSRGIDDGLIKRFGLGASSDEWDTLKEHLESKGYTQEELAAAGLVHVRDTHSYDVFRSRAIFPIIDLYGRTVGFGGRAMGDAQPKYLNTQDTLVFNKRLGLYGANYLRKMRDLKRVILVEGYMDVMALSKKGIQGAVATLGTALTPEQARLMKRLAPEVWVCYDGDEAGQNAIVRAIDILEKEMIPARVLQLPDGMDPDDYLKVYDVRQFEGIRPLSANHFRLLRLKKGYDVSSAEENSAFSLKACELIATVSSPLEREDLLRWLQTQTGYDKNILSDQVVQLTKGTAHQDTGQKPVSGPGRRARSAQTADEAEKTLLSLSATGHLPADLIRPDDFESTVIRGLWQAVANGKKPVQVLSECEDDESRAIASEAFSKLGDLDAEQVIPAAEDCIFTLRSNNLNQQVRDINRDMPNLAGDEKKRALERIMELTMALNGLKRTQVEGKEVS